MDYDDYYAEFIAHALDLSARGQAGPAARILRRLAENGVADAAAHLGWLLEVGEDLEGSAETPAHWYEISARGGSPHGALRHALELDDPDADTPTEAAHWYEVAREGLMSDGEEGDAVSLYLLWQMHDNGWGVPEDPTRAVAFLTHASMNGHLEASFILGNSYWDRPGRSEADRRYAIKEWRRAADRGLRDAQYHLGVKYATEEDMPINLEESVRYYSAAAENGDINALYNLGTMYLGGEGVAKDVGTGTALIVRAGRLGNVLAQSYLAAAYTDGYHGVPRDPDEAAYWQRQYDGQVPDPDTP